MPDTPLAKTVAPGIVASPATVIVALVLVIVTGLTAEAMGGSVTVKVT